MSTVWRCRTLRPTTQPGYGFLIQPMRKPDAYPEIVDAPDQRSSTFEAPGPDRARHRADVGSEQWRRAWLCAASTHCGAELALPESMDNEGDGTGAKGSLAKRPATGPDWVYVEKEQRGRSVTRLLLWEEYRVVMNSSKDRDQAADRIEIALANDRRVIVGPDVDAAVLARVVGALEPR